MIEPRPINADTVRQAAAELRHRTGDVAPATREFVADLLTMPVGHLLAHAEAAGQARARSIEATLRECDDGTCPVSSDVTEALLEVGPWSEIDGDGDVSSILADHVRELGRWYDLGRRLVAYVDRVEQLGPVLNGTADDAEVSAAYGDLTDTRRELADLFDSLATRQHREPPAAQIERLATFIMDHVPGEPSRSEGAVDVAIRLLGTWWPSHFPEVHWSASPPWLVTTVTHGGVKHLPPVRSVHKGGDIGSVKVQESSEASSPFVWLTVDERDPGRDEQHREAHAHLSLESAAMLRDQLTYLVENHYQHGHDPVGELAATVAIEHTDGTVDDLGPMTLVATDDDPGPIPVDTEVVQWDGSAAHASRVIDWVLAHDGTASYVDDEVETPHIRINVAEHGVAILTPGQVLAYVADADDAKPGEVWRIYSAKVVR